MQDLALITGASSGIGRELARIHAARGGDCVLVARRRDRLEQLAVELQERHAVRTFVVPADLSRPEAPGAIAAEIAGLGLEVEILVNNAGFGAYGRFWERPAADHLAMVQVNVASLTALCRLFLPAMVERGHGRILNVSSTAGFLPGPLQAVYYATKAYVTSLSEALAEELRGSGVTVTALCPGPVATEFAEVAGAQGSRLFKLPVSGPGPIADHGYRAMLAGKRVAIKEPLFKPLRVVAALAPRGLLLRMSRRLMERS